MSVTDVQHVYIRHAHTCIRRVLTEEMLTPAGCMIMPELNMLTPAGYMIVPELNMLTPAGYIIILDLNMPTPAGYMTTPDRNMLTPAYMPELSTFTRHIPTHQMYLNCSAVRW